MNDINKVHYKGFTIYQFKLSTEFRYRITTNYGLSIETSTLDKMIDSIDDLELEVNNREPNYN